MISVLTLTYQRHHLLEEAMQSFLLQCDDYDCEMVIINDSADVQYVYEHPKIRIINRKHRFSSIAAKLQWGFKQCKGDWIYRLDDDDLLSPYALEVNKQYRDLYPEKDILRDQYHYFFQDNQYKDLADSINNGNCYSAAYIKRVGKFKDTSADEDKWLTFDNDSDMHIGDTGKYTMIYRWGMGTYHISAMGHLGDSGKIFEVTDRTKREIGVIHLNPQFKQDYWSQITSK